MEQSKKLEEIINPKMSEINSKIFGLDVNNPEFHIETSKKYSFYTPNDDGTGTTFKGLVVMDIATLLTTSLPILIHDSVVLKQISNESIEKIFKIYDNLEKQVFISIDKDTSYTDKTVEVIRKDEVLKLSSGGNELYGFQFTLKEMKKMISYNKLWKLLIDKNLNKKELISLSGISSSTMAKITKCENVTTDALCKICKALNCDFKDIMEYIPE